MLLRSDAARCWGIMVRDGAEGEARIGVSKPITAYKAVTFPEAIRQVDRGCAALMNGDTYCWGVDLFGEAKPPRQIAEAGPAARLDIADAQCVVTTSARVRCWRGYDALYFEGTPVAGLNELPDENYEAVEPPLTMPVARILAFTQSACVLTPSGEVFCLGDNQHGALGVPGATFADLRHPVRVDVGARVTKLSSSGTRTCVVTEAGGVRCWGFGGDGGLGYGNTESVGVTRTPAQAGDVPL